MQGWQYVTVRSEFKNYVIRKKSYRTARIVPRCWG